MSLTARQASLFDTAYQNAITAAGQMNMTAHTGKITIHEADQVLTQLRGALCAWQTFRDLTAGVPEPKKGGL